MEPVAKRQKTNYNERTRLFIIRRFAITIEKSLEVLDYDIEEEIFKKFKECHPTSSSDLLQDIHTIPEEELIEIIKNEAMGRGVTEKQAMDLIHTGKNMSVIMYALGHRNNTKII